MHARARPSNKQHDGEERQRCGRKTMSSALFLADVWMKMRPARGAVRVTLDSPQTPASQKKITEGRISQIASSHIPLLNSVRLRFDSNLNRIGTSQGGREAEHLSDCSFHLTSTVRFSKRAGSHQNGQAPCAKNGHGPARSTCQARCARNKRTTCTVPRTGARAFVVTLYKPRYPHPLLQRLILRASHTHTQVTTRPHTSTH